MRADRSRCARLRLVELSEERQGLCRASPSTVISTPSTSTAPATVAANSGSAATSAPPRGPLNQGDRDVEPTQGLGADWAADIGHCGPPPESASAGPEGCVFCHEVGNMRFIRTNL
jgi:hypothetical protein